MTRIITVVVDEQNLTMYANDGSTIIIAQGDPRIRGIVEKVVPQVEKHGFYMLSDEDLNPSNTKHYTDTETATNGVVKFFRLAKKKLEEIAAKFSKPIDPMVVGSPLGELVPADPDDDFEVEEVPEEVQNELKQDLTRGQMAVAEIMANASSTASPAFHKEDVKGEEETVMVAVVDGETIIPNVDMIEPQLKAIAAKMGTVIGVTNFFRRLAKVQRNHSVVDLLKFMEKGELPIADDGTILVYKRLNKHGQGDTLYFTDVHSGKVKQKVGSHVFMAEKLVDPNRNNDCSNGLHIARRDYLRAFGGNVVVLCKLAPEDVISVPIYDARKLRCKGYTIVAVLSEKDASLVNQDRPMQDTVLLGNVAAGNHTEVLETVEITKHNGGGLIVTPTGANKQTQVVHDEAVTAQSLDKLPDVDPEQAKVNARDVAMGKVAAPTTIFQPGGAAHVEPVKDVNSGEEELKLVPAVVPSSKKRPVEILMENFTGPNTATSLVAAAHALLDYKKSCKKSWTALGVPVSLVDKLKGFEAASKADPVTPAQRKHQADAAKAGVDVSFRSDVVATLPATKAVKGVSLKATLAEIPKAKPTKSKVKPMADKAQPAVKKTQAERAAELLEVFIRVPRKDNAMALVNFKRTSKKSWDILGIDAKTVKRLMTYDV